ncbi:uncharacterized protein K452DRAFT_228315 [Aplosporella prunicola CBS 121167]|uniref:Vta1/callose synthase N-terminal domain-containing protein n=1 Tax=Aplosporella prunicola CBS 121167 TaxID=1176127 RepID=A0A6A6BEV1_9PEZI|nr:uncharacterized protein K452DRAFT_228315 [Aplosporella prunicola CBS 121167]KAF2141913.1 hypothetical protein K452DRAFT_228315 [Aplosporella prunicola CBS 121167]
MASKIPPGLRPADISRFAVRAAQLEKVKPVISYWCEYYMVNQIIAKGLHTTDEDCMGYTTTLMDKLEQTKTQHSDNDAILDDVAARAYVEQFALETFQRADNAVRANKVSAQTADTFRAAATFLDLSNVWGKPEPEIAAKSKYAKYHALRIAKALKAGEDPNASNPAPEPEPEESAPALDPTDPEVQRINGAASMQPTVEDAPPSFLPSPTFDQPSVPAAISPADAPPIAPPRPDHSDVSPLDAPGSRTNSVGGGYFPSVPTFTAENSVPTFTSENPIPSLPTAAPDAPMADSPSGPEDYYQTRAPPSVPPVNNIPAPSPPTNTYAGVDTTMSGTGGGGSTGYRYDDDAIMNAQKHAKWAISALNFEDVPTAVKELRVALQALGAN